MIITKLIGGLGNQMFQYAVGKSIAKKLDVDLALDITGYQNQKRITPRSFQLDRFKIRAKLINNESALPPTLANTKINRLLNKLCNSCPYIKAREQDCKYIKNLHEISKNLYLSGYWQSEKHFKDISKIIREDFRLKAELNQKNKTLKNKILNLEAVGLHVRRGDYVNDEKTNRHHGFLGVGYYQKAVKIMTQKTNPDAFFIFSDDIAWCKQNLNFIKVPINYIEDNQPEVDMKLMSWCKHNIIANSSFSWWGAWLNENENKTMIAPKQWFTGDSADTSDLVPEGWVRI